MKYSPFVSLNKSRLMVRRKKLHLWRIRPSGGKQLESRRDCCRDGRCSQNVTLGAPPSDQLTNL